MTKQKSKVEIVPLKKKNEEIPKSQSIEILGGNTEIRKVQALFSISGHLNRIANVLENEKK